MAVKSRFLLALAATAGLSACAVGPDYHFPEVAMPAHFGGPQQEVVSQATAPQADFVRWWQNLRDPELNRLIERAIAYNPDLEIALTRVQALRTQENIVMSNALPSAEATGAIAQGTGNDLTKGRTSGALRSGMNNTSLAKETRVGGFDATWELDLWGKYRRQLEAVQDDAQALNEMRHAVLITVISDVARTYADLRGLQLRLLIARNAAKAASQTADLAQARFNRGLTNELDVTLANRELAQVKARIPVLIAAIAAAESRLAVLAGTYSAEVAPELRKFHGLPHVPSRLRPGVPAELLRRRPDIRQAERQLAGATARIGVATANLFPTVALVGAGGLQGGEVTSASAARTKPPLTSIWSFGPGGYWPVLDFGKLDALINTQELAAHEALVNYKRTILVSVEEADNAIKQYRAYQQQLRELQVALEQSKRAVTLATERYERGITDFLNLLDAQRQEYGIEDQAAVSQAAVVVQYIALYKALGGGWELYDVLPPIKDAQPAVVAAARRVANDWH